MNTLARFALAAVLLSVAWACTEVEDPQIVPVGSVRILLAEPDLAPPTLEKPGIQTARWNVSLAEFVFPDGRRVNLLTPPEGENHCTFLDSIGLVTPINDPNCGGAGVGVVLGASSEPISLNLDLTLTMELERAGGPELEPLDDFDFDGVTNGEDNCPLVFNANQQVTADPPDEPDRIIDNPLLLPDACSVAVDTGFDEIPAGETEPVSIFEWVLDSDADGVPDLLDNCLVIANPGPDPDDFSQVDTDGDGIGDACEQVGLVDPFAGEPQPFLLTLTPEPFVLEPDRGPFLVVDFSSEEVLACDWEGGSCALDRDGVKICLAASPPLRGQGCP